MYLKGKERKSNYQSLKSAEIVPELEPHLEVSQENVMFAMVRDR